VEGLQLEKSALEKPARYALMIVILCVAAAWARWLTVSRASSREGDLLFEEKEAPAIYALDLHRDGRFQA
jgi:hypothetical protein